KKKCVNPISSSTLPVSRTPRKGENPGSGLAVPTRRPWPCLLLLILTVLLLAGGCRPAETEDSSRGREVVEFWCGWTGREAKVLQELVDRFNREQPALHVHLFTGVQDDT